MDADFETMGPGPGNQSQCRSTQKALTFGGGADGSGDMIHVDSSAHDSAFPVAIMGQGAGDAASETESEADQVMHFEPTLNKESDTQENVTLINTKSSLKNPK